jgi:hypothetical protein
MSEYNNPEHNNPEGVGEFAVDAGVDTAANNLANRVIEGVAEHIPGGQAIEPMIETEADLMLDNRINEGVNERIEGVEDRFSNQERDPNQSEY